MVNTKQAEDSLKELIKNPPKCVILINYSSNIFFDEVRFPLRINKIYHWLFESGLYKLVESNNALYLVLSPETYPNKINFISQLQSLFNTNLYRLPDVWGKSIKTLPMKEVSQNLKIIGNSIVSDEEINTHSADLLYINYSSDELVKFTMNIDESDFPIYFVSINNEVLIPLDNFPDWLLKDKVDKINFETNIPIKINKVKLYKRN